MRALEISIPYGAIKSVMIEVTCILSHKFQFLMVRLKASEQFEKAWQLCGFQFLMVRLKVC